MGGDGTLQSKRWRPHDSGSGQQARFWIPPLFRLIVFGCEGGLEGCLLLANIDCVCGPYLWGGIIQGGCSRGLIRVLMDLTSILSSLAGPVLRPRRVICWERFLLRPRSALLDTLSHLIREMFFFKKYQGVRNLGLQALFWHAEVFLPFFGDLPLGYATYIILSHQNLPQSLIFYHDQPSQKTFRTKRTLAKKQRQNRPLPQWIRLRTDNAVKYNAKRRHWRRTKLGL